MKGADIQREPARPIQNIADSLSNVRALEAPAFKLEAGVEEDKEEIPTVPDFFVQTKLTVGAPDDMYEKEADRVAEQIVSSGLVQRATESKPEEEEMLQTKQHSAIQFKLSADQNQAVNPNIQRQIQSAQGGGSALPGGVRGEMESAFGAGFDNVRVHTGTQANQLNESLIARAFTTGPDIFFKSGEYDPNSREGEKLLAHELTHVVQQGAAVGRSKQKQ